MLLKIIKTEVKSEKTALTRFSFEGAIRQANLPGKPKELLERFQESKICDLSKLIDLNDIRFPLYDNMNTYTDSRLQSIHNALNFIGKNHKVLEINENNFNYFFISLCKIFQNPKESKDAILKKITTLDKDSTFTGDPSSKLDITAILPGIESDRIFDLKKETQNGFTENDLTKIRFRVSQKSKKAFMQIHNLLSPNKISHNFIKIKKALLKERASFTNKLLPFRVIERVVHENTEDIILTYEQKNELREIAEIIADEKIKNLAQIIEALEEHPLKKSVDYLKDNFDKFSINTVYLALIILGNNIKIMGADKENVKEKFKKLATIIEYSFSSPTSNWPFFITKLNALAVNNS
jgi:hypothetical protein